MGLYYCENKERIYDIGSDSQAIVFLTLAVIYAATEVILILQTIAIFRKQKSAKQSPTIIIFFICIHVVFIRTIFYTLGGVVICYTEDEYLFLTTYLYIIKRFAFFVIVYRIAATYRYLTEFSELSVQILEHTVLIWGGIDSIIYNVIYTLSYYNITPFFPIYYYCLCVDIVLMIIFTYFSYKLVKLMDSMFTNIGMHHETFKLRVLVIIIFVSFLMRVLNTVYNLCFQHEIKSMDLYHYVETAIYTSLYLILTEIVPCMVMIWIMTSSESNKKNYYKKIGAPDQALNNAVN